MTMPAHDHNPETQPSAARSKPQPFGLFTPVVDLFSRVWFGISLLAILLVYGWVGSAGFWLPGHLAIADGHAWIHDIYWIIPWTQFHVRQSPMLELTEFAWFHWWPFSLLIALLCLNVAITTIRRIPFKPINYGVWTIHTGVILLALSCTWYFWAKVEGDVLLPMRNIVITLESGETGVVTAHPGNSITLGEGDDARTFEVQQIDPRWEIMSGQDAGKRTYSASVRVEGGEQTFMRQILAGYPQYTEDVVPSGEAGQPFVRLRNVTGERILDDSLHIGFEPVITEHMYLREQPALYVREHGQSTWHERPIQKLPRYHDHISDARFVWPTSEPTIRIGELRTDVAPTGEADPLSDITMQVTDILQYAFEDTNFANTVGELNPAVRVRLEAPGQQADYDLLAFDPLRASAESGRLAFRWLESEQQLQQMLKPARLHLSIAGDDVDEDDDDASFSQVVDITELQRNRFMPLGDTGYSLQFERVENDLTLDRETRFSVAMVLIQTPDGREFRRWVFDNPERNRDMPTTQFGPSDDDEPLFDTRLVTRYEPGGAPGTVTVLAGPDESQLRLLLTLPGREAEIRPFVRHTPAPLDRNVLITLLEYAPRAQFESRPVVIPRSQRDRNVGQQFSMIGVRIDEAMESKVHWVPFHLYPLEGSHERLRRFPYQPAVIALKDGRLIELLYSRQSYPLGFQVALDEFQLIEHVGGFTGQSLSVRDWRSIVRFASAQSDAAGSSAVLQSDPSTVAMNAPAHHDGLSFFQAQWDPPEPPSYLGLNYTVLGVGNRHGVNAMLASSCIIVIGLLYAFYVKPLIRRRKQLAALAAHATNTQANSTAGTTDTPEHARAVGTSNGIVAHADSAKSADTTDRSAQPSPETSAVENKP